MEVSLQSFKKRFTYDPQKDLLGKGGFGEVYKVYDTEDHIFVALKISQGTADDKYNLINEIKRFKKLSHPNIVKHIEAYEVNTGSSDIHGKSIAYHVGILEYANSGTLADLLKKGTHDYRLIEDLAKDIIEGLAYLHSENIIHRDLKPTNILLFSEGEKLRAKITDFGIAKITDATAASTQLVGTVEYMAPEFFKSDNAGITPAADLWSLGVILLEALTGTHPFGKTGTGSTSEQIIHNILFVNPAESQNFTSLPEPFKSIITNCLRREPNLRPSNAADLKHYFETNPQDVFGERTQVIDTKFKKTVSEKPKSRLRRWGSALFDFDFSKSVRNRTIAKELVVAFLVPVLSLILPILSLLCLYPLSEYKASIYAIESSKYYHLADSLSQYQPFTFANSYFGWRNEEQKIVFTDIGVVYDILHNELTSDKLEFDWFLRRISMYQESAPSYTDFIIYLDGKIKSDDQNWIFQTQQVIRERSDSYKNIDLVKALSSINNLSLDSPTYENKAAEYFPVNKFKADYFISQIEKRINAPGWLDWFVDNRVNHSNSFLGYLRKNKVTSKGEFKIFFRKVKEDNFINNLNCVHYKNEQKRFEDMEQEARALWGLKESAEDGELFAIAFGILLCVFYPIRILLAIIFWALKTLGFKFPSRKQNVLSKQKGISANPPNQAQSGISVGKSKPMRFNVFLLGTLVLLLFLGAFFGIKVYNKSIKEEQEKVAVEKEKNAKLVLEFEEKQRQLNLQIEIQKTAQEKRKFKAFAIGTWTSNSGNKFKIESLENGIRYSPYYTQEWWLYLKQTAENKFVGYLSKGNFPMSSNEFKITVISNELIELYDPTNQKTYKWKKVL